MVIGLARKRARAEPEMKLLVRACVAISVVMFILGLSLAFRLVPDQLVKDTVFSNGLSGFAAIGISLAILIAGFVGSVFGIPPQLYNEQTAAIGSRDTTINEQVAQLDELRQKLEHEILHPKLFITPVSVDQDGRIVGINIDNQSGHKVTNLWVTLDRLTLELSDGSKDDKPVAEADRGFPQGDFFDEPGAILPNRPVLVRIAEARDDQTSFLLKRDYPFHYICDENVLDTSPSVVVIKGSPLFKIPVGTAEYDVCLTVSGYIEGKHFKMKRVGHIHFQKGDLSTHTLARITSLEEVPNEEETKQEPM
jgi:hypothetical protein